MGCGCLRVLASEAEPGCAGRSRGPRRMTHALSVSAETLRGQRVLLSAAHLE
jgi:hypothetical protein